MLGGHSNFLGWMRVASGLLALAATAGVPDDLTIVDTVPDTGFGDGISRLGDVNGDGYADFAVNVSRAAVPGGGIGEVRVYFGSSAGISREPSQILRPPRPERGFGAASAGGDLNRDGYSDVIVLGLPPTGTNGVALSLWVYRGSARGLVAPTEPAFQDAPGSGPGGFAVIGDVTGDGFPELALGLPPANDGTGEVMVFFGNASCRWSHPDQRLRPDQPGEYFGCFGQHPSDFDRDGHADLVVGSIHYRGSDRDNGRAQLFLGSPRGLGTNAVWTATFPFVARPGIDESDEQYFGNAIAPVGDVNRDGFPDVVVTAPFAEQNDRNEGIAFGYYGMPKGLAPGVGWTIQANRPHAVLGLMAEPAGDVNGDGYADLMLGSPDFENGQLREGMVAVFLGSARGLPSEPDWTLESDRTHARLGQFGAGVGDVNRDGFDDLVINQSGSSDFDVHYGSIRVVYGTPQGPRDSTHLTLAKPILRWADDEWRRLSFPARGGLLVVLLSWFGIIGVVARRIWRRRTIILVERREESAREEERQRLARNLHDEVGSQLSRLALAVELVQRDEADPTQTRTLTKTLSTTARDLRLALQSLTSTLQPGSDEVAGLIEFVGHQADQFLGPLGIRCFHETPMSTPSHQLNPGVRQELVACLREAMGNVIRHSQATEVWIRITCDDATLRVGVEDNGTGFEPEVVRRGNGLKNFEERMHRVAGTVTINSRLGGGTHIEFQVPLLHSSRIAWN